MANIALGSASTALSALNTRLDVIANNLANVNTVGYKQSRANFEDLLYIERQQPGVESAFGDQRPIGLYVGLGVKVSGTQQNFSQGSPIQTGRDLDVMIDGNGFFPIQAINPQTGDDIAYTRAGNFTLNRDGEIVMANNVGQRLLNAPTVPADAIKIEIDETGQIFVQQPNTIGTTLIGQIELATFVNPAGLRQLGENLWGQSDASGDPIIGQPLQDDRGRILQGFLEASNVDPTRELIELIRTQRAFEMNSQSIRAADEVLRTVAQLRR